MEFEKLYTAEDVAEITGLTLRTIRNYIKDGRLKGHRIGVQWRFTAADIQALFDVPIEESRPASAPKEKPDTPWQSQVEKEEQSWPHLSENLSWGDGAEPERGQKSSSSGRKSAAKEAAASASPVDEEKWMDELTASLASAVAEDEAESSSSVQEPEEIPEDGPVLDDWSWWSSLMGESGLQDDEDLSFVSLDEAEEPEEKPEPEPEPEKPAFVPVRTEEAVEAPEPAPAVQEAVPEKQEKSLEEELSEVSPPVRQAYEYLIQGQVSHACSCAIVDIPVSSARDAESLYNRLQTLAGVYKDDARRLELSYEYDEEWGQVRYVFSGAMESVCAMLNLCDVQ